ncbi:DUF4823 domain-containing protein [Halomonas lysinitropha]|uniref:DUF4823 domain-containing protein n=1 Tax=Halomonas lysinitropha TaxID=2607506 RepID=UPI00124A71A9|nr:DUF4823 domain-containing protein [Halomonas lysinitropha]
MKLIFPVTFLFLLSGCAASYHQESIKKPDAKLDRNGSVSIAMPANGFYGSQEYQSSGRMTASAVRSAFSKVVNTTDIIPECQDINCMIQAHSATYDYHVIPDILHWEDRATEWSGKPDRIEVKITVYGSQVTSEIASTTISGKSKWATLGGDHPQDLLSEPINAYVRSLYSK